MKFVSSQIAVGNREEDRTHTPGMAAGHFDTALAFDAGDKALYAFHQWLDEATATAHREFAAKCAEARQRLGV